MKANNINNLDELKKDSSNSSFERFAYVFQGGGALGAYQVGIFQALQEHGCEPNWVIGTSIGAINASIIAGNKPKDRISKLKEFWDNIATNLLPGFEPQDEITRRWYNYISAQMSMWFGQPGFFEPRQINPVFSINGTPDTISFYLTEPLRKTLERLVDFDLINNGKTRLTLGAVEVCTGKSVNFDNTQHKIGPEHVIASGALPPGFPAIKIGDEFYWDGGVVSNTPLNTLLHDSNCENTICFMANLFDSYGLSPSTLDDVIKRHKDINYSSQYRQLIQSYCEMYHMRSAIHYLHERISDELREDPKVKKLLSLGRCAMIHFVRFLYTANPAELSSKDYEFSKLSITERMACGYRDGMTAVEKSPWLEPISPEVGVAVHEIREHRTIFEKMEI